MAQPNPRDWLRAYLGVQKVADREILRVLEDAEVNLRQQINRILQRPNALTVSESVRLAQLREIRREMLRQQAVVFKRLGDVINEGRVNATLAAVAANNRMDSILFNMVGDSATAKALADSIEQSLIRTIDVVTARMTQSTIPLSQRIYTNDVRLGGQIDRMINSALARGLSAREFAAEARGFFDPRTPGGVRYASMRLARTEINNAFHAMSVEAADKPWVTGMQWHLSRSHPKADDCDTLAHDDQFKMGPGVFPVRDVPRKPHPQCLCFVTPVVVKDDEFINSLFAGKYDNYLAGHGALPSQRQLSVVPSAKAVKVAAKAAKTPSTEAQLLAAARRKATAHAKRIFNGPTTPATTRSLKELQRQGRITPRAMLRLQRVETGSADSAFGKRWATEEKANTGAVYRYADRDIRISPQIIEDPARYDRAFDTRFSNGWFSHSDASGIESTVAHEYGHHLDFRISVNGNYPAEMADQLMPVLIQELGLTNAAVGTGDAIWNQGATLYWQTFDRLVSRNKSRLESRVSKYGSKNGRELIAEIWAEYTTAKHPRPYIKKIGDVIKRLAEERSI